MRNGRPRRASARAPGRPSTGSLGEDEDAVEVEQQRPDAVQRLDERGVGDGWVGHHGQPLGQEVLHGTARRQEGADLRCRQRPLDRVGHRQGAPRRRARPRLLVGREPDRAAGPAPRRLDRRDVRRALRRPGRRADRAACWPSGRTRYGELDILVHALAFAKREDLEGEFVDTSRDGFALALDVSAYSLVALARAARPLLKPGRERPDADLLRRREGRRELQRDGRGEGRAGGVACATSPPTSGRDGIRVNAISAGPIRTLAASGIAGFKKLYGSFAELAPLRANITIEDVGGDRASGSPATCRAR